MKKKIFITGGCGYIRYFNKKITCRWIQCVRFTDLWDSSVSSNNKDFELIKGDIRIKKNYKRQSKGLMQSFISPLS